MERQRIAQKVDPTRRACRRGAHRAQSPSRVPKVPRNVTRSEHGRSHLDFDFLTDSVLVCTELVYKSFQAPKGEGTSLSIPLVRIAGRTTLPATEIVRKFDLDFGKPDQQLDFVAFLDGRESLGRAVEGTSDDLRKSYLRPKWDVAQR